MQERRHQLKRLELRQEQPRERPQAGVLLADHRRAQGVTPGLAEYGPHLIPLRDRPLLVAQARRAHQPTPPRPIGGRHERDGCTRSARAPGSTDAVNVGLGVLRDPQVEDVRDAAHVDPARRDVRGDEHAELPTTEGVQRARPGGLRQVAVQESGVEAFTLQAVRERLALGLGVAEHDRQRGLLDMQHVHEGVFTVLAKDLVDDVRDLGRGLHLAA